jgi:hypothetical protein
MSEIVPQGAKRMGLNLDCDDALNPASEHTGNNPTPCAKVIDNVIFADITMANKLSD